MRLALKSTLAFFVVYILIVGAVGWWMTAQLQALASSMADSTAQLVGGEVARALADIAVEELQVADDATRARLQQIVDDVTQHSSILVSVAVVDRSGKVVAGDNVEPGRQMAIPDAIFGDDYSTRLLSESGPLGGGSFHMLVPLKADRELAGYLRLEMRSERIARLYSGVTRDLLLVAFGGLLAVGGAGLLLQRQIERRGEAVAHALEGAVRGEATAATGHDEFSRAMAIARKVGQELTEARGERLQAQHRMGALIRALDVGVLVLEPDLSLGFANARAAELFGCEPAELARQWDHEIRADLADVSAQIDGDTGRRAEIELPARGTAPRLTLELYALGEASNCEGYLTLVKSAESLEALQSELGLAIQMRGLTRFYAAFVHDLKAPLNAMVMTLELLKITVQGNADSGDSHAKQLKYIGVLNDEIHRLDRQLRALLSHTAPPTQGRQPVDLRALIAELEALLGPQAKRQRVNVSLRLPEAPVTLVGQADRLKQALLNILINALEAMPDGGELTMALEQSNGAVRVRIEDNGPGIPPEVLGGIYEMHFTTKSGGTGVGLYVARAVVQAHGGAVEVDTTPGQGTTFTLTIPVSASV